MPRRKKLLKQIYALSLSIMLVNTPVTFVFADTTVTTAPANTGNYTLSDSGLITIDTNITQTLSDGSGGTINLNAGKLITINQGRILDVSATRAGKNGGSINLTAPALIINGTLKANGSGSGQGGSININVPATATPKGNYIQVGSTAVIEAASGSLVNASGKLLSVSVHTGASYYDQTVSTLLAQMMADPSSADIQITGDGFGFAGIVGDNIRFVANPGSHYFEGPDRSIEDPAPPSLIEEVTSVLPLEQLENLSQVKPIATFNPPVNPSSDSYSLDNAVQEVISLENLGIYIDYSGSQTSAVTNTLSFSANNPDNTGQEATAIASATASTGDINIQLNLGPSHPDTAMDKKSNEKNKTHIKEFKHTIVHDPGDNKGQDKQNTHLKKETQITENIYQAKNLDNHQQAISHHAVSRGDVVSAQGDSHTIRNITYLSQQPTPASAETPYPPLTLIPMPYQPGTSPPAPAGDQTITRTTFIDNSVITVINNKSISLENTLTSEILKTAPADSAENGNTLAMASASASTGDINIELNLTGYPLANGKTNPKASNGASHTKEFTHIIEHFKGGGTDGERNNTHIQNKTHIAQNIHQENTTYLNKQTQINHNVSQGDNINTQGDSTTIQNISYFIQPPAPVTPMGPPMILMPLPLQPEPVANRQAGDIHIIEKTIIDNSVKTLFTNSTTAAWNNTLIKTTERSNSNSGSGQAMASASATTGDIHIALNLSADQLGQGPSNQSNGTTHIKEFTHIIEHDTGNRGGGIDNTHIKNDTHISRDIYQADSAYSNTQTLTTNSLSMGDTIQTKGDTTNIQNITYQMLPSPAPLPMPTMPELVILPFPQAPSQPGPPTEGNTTITRSTMIDNSVTSLMQESLTSSQNNTLMETIKTSGGSPSGQALATATASTGDIHIELNLNAGQSETGGNLGPGEGNSHTKEFRHTVIHNKGNGNRKNNTHIKTDTRTTQNIFQKTVSHTNQQTVANTNVSKGDTIHTQGNTTTLQNIAYPIPQVTAPPTSTPSPQLSINPSPPALSQPNTPASGGNTIITETTAINNAVTTVNTSNTASLVSNTTHTLETGENSASQATAMAIASASTGEINIQVNLGATPSAQGHGNHGKGNGSNQNKEFTHTIEHIKGNTGGGSKSNTHIKEKTDIRKNTHQEQTTYNRSLSETHQQISQGDTLNSQGNTTTIENITYESLPSAPSQNTPEMPVSQEPVLIAVPQPTHPSQAAQETPGGRTLISSLTTLDNTMNSVTQNNVTHTQNSTLSETLQADNGQAGNAPSGAAFATATASTGDINIQLNLGTGTSRFDKSNNGINQDKGNEHSQTKAFEHTVQHNPSGQGGQGNKNNTHIKTETRIAENSHQEKATDHHVEAIQNNHTSQGQTITTQGETSLVQNITPPALPSAPAPTTLSTTIQPSLAVEPSPLPTPEIPTEQPVVTPSQTTHITSTTNTNNTVNQVSSSTTTTKESSTYSQTVIHKNPSSLAPANSSATATATTGSINIQIAMGPAQPGSNGPKGNQGKPNPIDKETGKPNQPHNNQSKGNNGNAHKAGDSDHTKTKHHEISMDKQMDVQQDTSVSNNKTAHRDTVVEQPGSSRIVGDITQVIVQESVNPDPSQSPSKATAAHPTADHQKIPLATHPPASSAISEPTLPGGMDTLSEHTNNTVSEQATHTALYTSQVSSKTATQAGTPETASRSGPSNTMSVATATAQTGNINIQINLGGTSHRSEPGKGNSPQKDHTTDTRKPQQTGKDTHTLAVRPQMTQSNKIPTKQQVADSSKQAPVKDSHPDRQDNTPQHTDSDKSEQTDPQFTPVMDQLTWLEQNPEAYILPMASNTNWTLDDYINALAQSDEVSSTADKTPQERSITPTQQTAVPTQPRKARQPGNAPTHPPDTANMTQPSQIRVVVPSSTQTSSIKTTSQTTNTNPHRAVSQAGATASTEQINILINLPDSEVTKPNHSEKEAGHSPSGQAKSPGRPPEQVPLKGGQPKQVEPKTSSNQEKPHDKAEQQNEAKPNTPKAEKPDTTNSPPPDQHRASPENKPNTDTETANKPGTAAPAVKDTVTLPPADKTPGQAVNSASSATMPPSVSQAGSPALPPEKAAKQAETPLANELPRFSEWPSQPDETLDKAIPIQNKGKK